MFEDDFYDRLARYYDLFQSDLEPSEFAGQVRDIIERYCTAEGDGEGGRKTQDEVAKLVREALA